MKKIVALAGALVIGCMSLFAFNGVQVRKITDHKIMSLEMNYHFIDAVDYDYLLEPCIVENEDVAIFFDSNSKSIKIYSHNENCAFEAKQAIAMANNGNVQDCILYKQEF